jgi:hypothetical protein
MELGFMPADFLSQHACDPLVASRVSSLSVAIDARKLCRTTEGGTRDYFKPHTSGTTMCDMLTGSKNFIWSRNGIDCTVFVFVLHHRTAAS